MPITLTVPSQISENYVFPFISDMWAAREHQDVSIDYSLVKFARPFGALVLASEVREFAEYRKEHYNYSTYAKNIDFSNNRAHSYLGHIGFFQHQLLDIGNKPGEALGSMTYVPVTPITLGQFKSGALSDNDIKRALERESERLAQVLLQTPLPTALHPVTYCLTEIIRNVFEHAETEECLLCAQKYESTEIEIALLDRGRGIKSSLQERYHFNNNYEALSHALMPGVSRVPKEQTDPDDEWANSGFGLYVLSRLSSETGEFIISSGTDGLYASKDTKTIVNFPFRGTAVKMNVKKPKGINMNDYIRRIIKEGEEIAQCRSASKSTKRI